MNFFLQPGEGILLKYESGWVDEATIITPKTKTVLDDVTAVILTSRRLVLECRETVETFALSDLIVYDNRIQLFANQDYEIELYFRDARVQLPRMESPNCSEYEYCDLWIDSIADAYNGLFPASPDEPYEDEETDEDEDEDEEYDENGNEDGKTYNDDAEIEQIRYAARSFLEITNKLAEDDREILLEAVGLAVESARSEQQSDEEIPSKNPEAEEAGADFLQSFNRVMKKLSKKEQDIVYAVIGHVVELTEAGLLDVDADDVESPLSPVSDPDQNTRSVKPAAPPPTKSRSRKDVRPRCPRCRCTYGENDIYCGFCGWKLQREEKNGVKTKPSAAERKKEKKKIEKRLKAISLACCFAGIAFFMLAVYLELYDISIGGIAFALGSELLYAFLDREKPRNRKK